MTDKDKKIIEDSERDGIPIFVLTAKDRLALDTIIAYREMCAKACTPEHFQGVEKRIDDFYKWRIKNEGKMKMPD